MFFWFASDSFSIFDAFIKLVLVFNASVFIICFCHRLTNHKKTWSGNKDRGSDSTHSPPRYQSGYTNQVFNPNCGVEALALNTNLFTSNLGQGLNSFQVNESDPIGNTLFGTNHSSLSCHQTRQTPDELAQLICLSRNLVDHSTNLCASPLSITQAPELQLETLLEPSDDNPPPYDSILINAEPNLIRGSSEHHSQQASAVRLDSIV